MPCIYSCLPVTIVYERESARSASSNKFQFLWSYLSRNALRASCQTRAWLYLALGLARRPPLFISVTFSLFRSSPGVCLFVHLCELKLQFISFTSVLMCFSRVLPLFSPFNLFLSLFLHFLHFSSIFFHIPLVPLPCFPFHPLHTQVCCSIAPCCCPEPVCRRGRSSMTRPSMRPSFRITLIVRRSCRIHN